MATYRLRSAARHDLEDIWDYTLREWSVSQAIAYTDEIEAALVSQPRELPPRLLAEPGVNLSAHRAPIVPTIKPPRPFQ